VNVDLQVSSSGPIQLGKSFGEFALVIHSTVHIRRIKKRRAQQRYPYSWWRKERDDAVTLDKRQQVWREPKKKRREAIQPPGISPQS